MVLVKRRVFFVPFQLTMRLVDVLQRLIHHPTLNTITLDKVSRYTRLILHLTGKESLSILLAQPLGQSSRDITPDFLPQSITAFLSDALDLPENGMEESWEVPYPSSPLIQVASTARTGKGFRKVVKVHNVSYKLGENK